MFEEIQYLVSSNKLEDGFGMDNVVVVKGRGKITRSCDDNMGLDLQIVHNNIARKPSFAWFFWDGIPYGTIISHKFY